jgi:hypothetical protein
MQEDEFGILLTYRGTDEARALADGIRSDIAAGSLSIGGEEVSFTVSIGIAPITEASPAPKRSWSRHAGAGAGQEPGTQPGGGLRRGSAGGTARYKRDRDASRERLDEAMSTDTLVLRAQPIVKAP